MESLFPIWGIREADCENFLLEVYRNIKLNCIEFTKNRRDENDEFQGFIFSFSSNFEAGKRVNFFITFSTVMGEILRIRYWKILPPDQSGLSIQFKISPKNGQVKFQRRKEIGRGERGLPSEIG